jgi:TolA-binding protein
MLTLGNCQLETGNKAAAKKIFSDILAKYPDSDAAQQAQSLMSATK